MRFLLAVPLLFACSGDPGEPAILDFMAMPAAGAPGDEITVMVTVEDFELVGGGMDMSMDMDMDMSDHDDHDHGHGDAGHIHVYMDDTQSNPLVMMMSDTGTFEVPADATEGMHTLIARLQDCLLYTSPSPRDVEESRMPSSA